MYPREQFSTYNSIRAPAPPTAVTRRREEGAVGRSLRTGFTHGTVQGPPDGVFSPTAKNERGILIELELELQTQSAFKNAREGRPLPFLPYQKIRKWGPELPSTFFKIRKWGLELPSTKKSRAGNAVQGPTQGVHHRPRGGRGSGGGMSGLPGGSLFDPPTARPCILNPEI